MGRDISRPLFYIYIFIIIMSRNPIRYQKQVKVRPNNLIQIYNSWHHCSKTFRKHCEKTRNWSLWGISKNFLQNLWMPQHKYKYTKSYIYKTFEDFQWYCWNGFEVAGSKTFTSLILFSSCHWYHPHGSIISYCKIYRVVLS